MRIDIKNNIKLNTRGQTLVEALVALVLVGILLSAISIAVVTGVNNSNFLRDQDGAGEYAKEGMDYVRNLKERDYTTFNSKNLTNYCIDYDNTTGALIGISDTPCTQESKTGFIHELTLYLSGQPGDCDLSPNPVRGARVNVKVRWRSGKCTSANEYCHSSTLESCFTDNSVNPLPIQP